MWITSGFYPHIHKVFHMKQYWIISSVIKSNSMKIRFYVFAKLVFRVKHILICKETESEAVNVSCETLRDIWS